LTHHDTPVSQMKLFGNALRNSITRMSNDPVDCATMSGSFLEVLSRWWSEQLQCTKIFLIFIKRIYRWD